MNCETLQRAIDERRPGDTAGLPDDLAAALTPAARAFFERRFAEYPRVSIEKKSKIVPKNVGVPLAFCLFLVVWFLERRRERFSQN